MIVRFSEACKNAMDLADSEAQRSGHGAVDIAHILLSFLHDETCSASVVLHTIGVNTLHLRRLLEAQLSQEVREESSGGDRLFAKTTIDEKRVEGLIKEGKVFRIPKDTNRHPQTPALKRSVERAIALAEEIGPSQEPLAEGSSMAEVGTGHWLLGILENAALRTILATIGVDVVAIRDQVNRA